MSSRPLDPLRSSGCSTSFYYGIELRGHDAGSGSGSPKLGGDAARLRRCRYNSRRCSSNLSPVLPPDGGFLWKAGRQGLKTSPRTISRPPAFVDLTEKYESDEETR